MSTSNLSKVDATFDVCASWDHQLLAAITFPHTDVRSGVVSADLFAQYQGTGLPTGGRGGVIAPRVRVGAPSGVTSWSPPV
ncbi:hypothetical protein [Angustibacter aerolatus]